MHKPLSSLHRVPSSHSPPAGCSLGRLLGSTERLSDTGAAELDLEDALHLSEELGIRGRLHVLVCGDTGRRGSAGSSHGGSKTEPRLTLLDDGLLLVDCAGEVALAHRLRLTLAVLEVLPGLLEDLAELHRDRRWRCHLVL